MHAVMDIGTNSVRLLVANLQEKQLIPVRHELRITRLGQDVDRQGCLAEAAMERTLQALEEYREIVSSLPVSTVQLTATSAVRDSANRDEFADQIRRRVGWEVRILGGDEEAQLSFLGAVDAAGSSLGGSTKIIVTDIGGGSSEVVVGISDGTVLAAYSLQLGSVRMTEKWITSHPVPDDEVARLQLSVRTQLADELPSYEEAGAAVLVAVGGTATTMAAVALGLAAYDALSVTRTIHTKETIADMRERLRRMTLADRSKVIGLVPGREDVIVAGLSILLGLMEHFRAGSVMVVDSDLLQGLILQSAVVD